MPGGVGPQFIRFVLKREGYVGQMICPHVLSLAFWDQYSRARRRYHRLKKHAISVVATTSTTYYS